MTSFNSKIILDVNRISINYERVEVKKEAKN